MSERRKTGRSRVIKGAKLIFGKESVMDCVVRNLTSSGARVQIANSINLPDTMSLSLDNGRTVRQCRTAWRTLHETGIEFCDDNVRQSSA